ncbi:hypothetical protein OG241_00970 [Streptomyces sp. NBC_01390]|uniref:hypothetical protein n=1 Tax=Streptomyces sp. NBC_01390 TaxID=2903850 RepID=UPI0032556011
MPQPGRGGTPDASRIQAVDAPSGAPGPSTDGRPAVGHQGGAESHAHLQQDDATILCPDRRGTAHSRRDAATGAEPVDASRPSRTGRTTPEH